MNLREISIFKDLSDEDLKKITQKKDLKKKYIKKIHKYLP